MSTSVAIPEWANPDDKVITGELVAKNVDPAVWANFLGLIETGKPVAEALKLAKLSRYKFNGALRTDTKAREQYDEARINAVWRNWDFETVEEIMTALMTNRCGGYLNKILDDMGVDTSSFYYLMTRDPAVKEMYEEARQVQAEIQADEMQAIADHGLNDTYTDDKGRVRVDQDVVQRSRLRVDTLKWRLSKLHWKRFGDRIQQDQNINLTVDHAQKLEAGRKRVEELNAARAKGKVGG